MATLTQDRPLTSNVIGLRYDANGDVHVDFQLLDANGAVVQTRSLTCKADGTGVYDQRDGSQVASTTPAQLMTYATNLHAAIDSALTSAANAGKLVA